MKGLLSILGLVIALFISSFARADIYSQAGYQGPERSTQYNVKDNSGVNHKTSDPSSHVLSVCMSDFKSPEYYNHSYEQVNSSPDGRTWFQFDCKFSWKDSAPCSSCEDKTITNRYTYYFEGDTSSCPPDEYPNYTYEKDDDGDGQADRCFDPMELDNASQCQNTVGSMLPALTNTASSVCVTDSATGARCGFSRSNMGNSYQANLEMSCFGNDEIPEYTDEPMPSPETCTKMNSNLMVCVADPNEKCDFYGVCQDDCGYVNGQFYCFTPCVGAECDAETPPDVDCSATPDHPSCVPAEPEIPENCTKSGAGLICKEDPSEKCDEQGVCQDGCGYINGTFVCYQSPGSGGGLFDINIQPIVDELKALNKKFDFTTKEGEGRKEFGNFDELFGEADIAEIKQMVDDKKNEASQLLTDIKAEFSGLFNITSVGGAYEPLTLDFSYGSYTSKVWEFFQQNVSIIAAAIMAFAWLAAATIVMSGGRND
ncbi:hypothetical protein L2728_21605 [Shewanella chilikensis]|uniref:hypothetical protein n=1 Tax=Shewanella chilikensis TaxID=558541 RepID=UPI00200BC77B|nr:hypothetical protein [Shewanella chilikensis]MCL1164414.1 hypothetical protein [Shewanella chilikensis]